MLRYYRLRYRFGGWNIRRVTAHLGELLRQDFLLPLSLSANKLAFDLRVPVTRITEILHECRGITADTALQLGRYFGMSAELWMNFQKSYDLSKARTEFSKQINFQTDQFPNRSISKQINFQTDQ